MSSNAWLIAKKDSGKKRGNGPPKKPTSDWLVRVPVSLIICLRWTRPRARRSRATRLNYLSDDSQRRAVKSREQGDLVRNPAKSRKDPTILRGHRFMVRDS